jgi:hypothetical protein
MAWWKIGWSCGVPFKKYIYIQGLSNSVSSMVTSPMFGILTGHLSGDLLFKAAGL